MSASLDEAIASLEAYLRRYPSGNFAEIAQAKLDRLLAMRGERRITVVSSGDNPHSKGHALARTDWQVGDRYEWRIVDLDTELEHRRTDVVTAVTDLQVFFDSGVVTNLIGNPVLDRRGRRIHENQNIPADCSVGKKWKSRYRIETSGDEGYTDLEWSIVGREVATLPAGRFNAFRAEGRGWTKYGGQRDFTFWMDPEKVRLPIVREHRRRDWGRPGRSERLELVSYFEAPPK